ncbi:MAG: dTMP kinase [Desulfobacteraceae bacterium 4572_35.1]|nr:MAG: dTMP kinase [Desulfobacteraceae bacterium 4572_35.1]
MEQLSGVFITFEGIEGCGKTTQIARLAESLRQQHLPVVVTREPGGCAISDKIRAILLDADNSAITPETELLLYAAARAQHISEVIRPALQQGKIVLCDRFCDATIAYQGCGRNLDITTIKELNNYACQKITPQLTLVLDIDVNTGLTRARSRNAKSQLQNEDRFEAESLNFHQRIRDAYLDLSYKEPQRIAVIDASGNQDDVHNRIYAAVVHSISTANN